MLCPQFSPITRELCRNCNHTSNRRQVKRSLTTYRRERQLLRDRSGDADQVNALYPDISRLTVQVLAIGSTATGLIMCLAPVAAGDMHRPHKPGPDKL